MIVYGDPAYTEQFPRLAKGLLARATWSLDTPQLEELRTLLIMAGQLEQAAQDSLPSTLGPEEAQPYAAATHRVTALLASAFYTVWASCNSDAPPGRVSPGTALADVLEPLQSIAAGPDVPVTVKLPEGFAFYALYPEQYCTAALRWLRDHAAEEIKKAAVVGIRSIGTTLGAVVTATLEAGGWQVSSLSVRPKGHPFSRVASIEPGQVVGAEWALVVDEGPGMSGSSMSAVGEALVRAGVERGHISFFPGHGGEPGGAASEEVRGWWRETPRYVVPLHEVQFGGLSLTKALADWPYGSQEGLVSVEDLSGGRWRKLAFPNKAKWPAVCAPFERPKYLITDSSNRRVLFKFEGLCGAPGGRWTTAEAAHRLLEDREKLQPGGGVTPLGVIQGFLAVHWEDGLALMSQQDLTPRILAHLGGYIAHVAGLPIAAEQQEEGTARLAEMLYWNTWEVLSEEWAARTRSWSEKATSQLISTLPTYGDGRMAPHEWLLNENGRVKKVDSAGHTWDHTCIGVQPVTWDLGGAIIEWGLDEAGIATLLTAFYKQGGPPIDANALHFYRLAYAAFRAGQCHLCANIAAYDPEEQARLWKAYAGYREQLRGLLAG